VGKYINSEGLVALILIIVITGAFYLGGGGFFEKIVSDNPDSLPVSTTTQCCDTGDGDACKPQTEENNTITFKGENYGLIKSSIKFVEGNLHLKNSNQTVDINGESYPVILNSSDTHKNFTNSPSGTCDNSNTDKYLKGQPPSIYDPSAINFCTQIPNDQIIFVCKENCKEATFCDNSLYQDPNLSCYGDETTQYDTYFKLSDYNDNTNSGVPDFIKNCNKNNLLSEGGTVAKPSIIVEDFEKKDNLQLETFKVVAGSIAVPWFSPFCKPAIYLYPEEKTQVSVKVNPVGKFTYTDPIYPKNGWIVTAYPDGKIISGIKEFPYLYYEADIPSLLVEKPREGFIVSKSNIESKLKEILPTLGLNTKESSGMIDYWKYSLPESPYYFIGIIPQETLDVISPLNISPKPDTTIRIALFFEPLDTYQEVKPPYFLKPDRSGFSVVEWGGIVKTDKPFACLQ
jgi:hypothetical protein